MPAAKGVTQHKKEVFFFLNGDTWWVPSRYHCRKMKKNESYADISKSKTPLEVGVFTFQNARLLLTLDCTI